jgi:hypothetical protein
MNRPIQILLAIILVVFLIGMLPTWRYSAGWGYFPSGGAGLVLLIILMVLLLGRDRKQSG